MSRGIAVKAIPWHYELHTRAGEHMGNFDSFKELLLGGIVMWCGQPYRICEKKSLKTGVYLIKVDPQTVDSLLRSAPRDRPIHTYP